MVFLTGRVLKYMPYWMPRGTESHTQSMRYMRKQALYRLTFHYYGRARNCYKLAINNFTRSLRIATEKRKEKAYFMKDLFSQRILAACDEHGLEYKYFMGMLPQVGIELDRKMLAWLAIWEPRTFKSLVDICRAKLNEQQRQDYITAPTPGVITRGML